MLLRAPPLPGHSASRKEGVRLLKRHCHSLTPHHKVPLARKRSTKIHGSLATSQHSDRSPWPFKHLTASKALTAPSAHLSCHPKGFLLWSNSFNNYITTTWRCKLFLWQRIEEQQLQSLWPAWGPGLGFSYFVHLIYLQCWQLRSLKKYHLQCFLKMFHLQRDRASARGTGTGWGLYQSFPTAGTQVPDHSGGPTPLLSYSSPYPDYTKSK